MAISPEYPGLEVAILVGGEPLKEYVKEDSRSDSSSKVVTRYIETVPGSDFNIRLTLPRGLHDSYSVQAVIKLSGAYNRKPVYLNSEFAKQHQTYIEGNYFVPNHPGSPVDLVFPRAHPKRITTPPKAVLSETYILTAGPHFSKKGRFLPDPTWGDVTISLFFIKNFTRIDTLGYLTDKAMQSLQNNPRYPVAENTPIQPETGATCLYFNFEHLDTKKQPFATFKFEYRSAEDLKHEKVIHKDPTIVPLEDRPVGVLSAADLEKLVTHYRNKEASSKPTPKQKEASGRKRNKPEETRAESMQFLSQRPVKRQQFPSEDDEVIDVD